MGLPDIESLSQGIASFHRQLAECHHPEGEEGEGGPQRREELEKGLKCQGEVVLQLGEESLGQRGLKPTVDQGLLKTLSSYLWLEMLGAVLHGR